MEAKGEKISQKERVINNTNNLVKNEQRVFQYAQNREVADRIDTQEATMTRASSVHRPLQHQPDSS